MNSQRLVPNYINIHNKQYHVLYHNNYKESTKEEYYQKFKNRDYGSFWADILMKDEETIIFCDELVEPIEIVETDTEDDIYFSDTDSQSDEDIESYNLYFEK
jgi:hypothetical protein